MKYKVGDKVRVKSKEWWNSHTKNEYGEVECGDVWFTSRMTYMCGSIVEIEKVLVDRYHIRDSIYRFTDEMLEDIVSEVNQTDQLIKDISEVIKKNNLGISVKEESGKLIIEPLKK